MKQYNVGVIGATGMVGQRFITLLENHPWFNLVALAASARSAGKTYEEAVGSRWLMKTPMPESVKKMVVLDAANVEEVAAKVDFVFCAVNMKKDEIKALEEAYAKAECPVVSNNSAHRFTPDVPMVVPEINADINIIPAVKRVSGVGGCEVMGAKTYSMRIWLDPVKMKNYGLMPTDISNVLAEQNIEAAPGKFGEQSDNQYEYTIRYKGRLQTPTEFENMVISSDANGNTIRVKDVARVELGGLYYNVTSKVNGQPAVMMMVTQTAGSNATQIVNDIKKVIDEQRTMLPPGVEIV